MGRPLTRPAAVRPPSPEWWGCLAGAVTRRKEKVPLCSSGSSREVWLNVFSGGGFKERPPKRLAGAPVSSDGASGQPSPVLCVPTLAHTHHSRCPEKTVPEPQNPRVCWRPPGTVGRNCRATPFPTVIQLRLARGGAATRFTGGCSQEPGKGWTGSPGTGAPRNHMVRGPGAGPGGALNRPGHGQGQEEGDPPRCPFSLTQSSIGRTPGGEGGPTAAHCQGPRKV